MQFCRILTNRAIKRRILHRKRKKRELSGFSGIGWRTGGGKGARIGLICPHNTDPHTPDIFAGGYQKGKPLKEGQVFKCGICGTIIIVKRAANRPAAANLCS